MNLRTFSRCIIILLYSYVDNANALFFISGVRKSFKIVFLINKSYSQVIRDTKGTGKPFPCSRGARASLFSCRGAQGPLAPSCAPLVALLTNKNRNRLAAKYLKITYVTHADINSFIIFWWPLTNFTIYLKKWMTISSSIL